MQYVLVLYECWLERASGQPSSTYLNTRQCEEVYMEKESYLNNLRAPSSLLWLGPFLYMLVSTNVHFNIDYFKEVTADGTRLVSYKVALEKQEVP